MQIREPNGVYGKDAYYFPHDSNAKDDPKCIQLIESLGLEGYGIFWILLEILRDQPNYKYPINALSGIARRYNTTPDKVNFVVTKTGLFVIEDDLFFYSPSFTRRMMSIDRRRELASEHGKRGNEIRWGKRDSIDNQLLLSGGDGVASGSRSQEKKRKEKESKEKKEIIKKKDLLFGSDFWKQEIEININKPKITGYKNLHEWLVKNKADHLLRLPAQLSYEEYVSCVEYANGKGVSFQAIIQAMANSPKYFVSDKDKVLKVSFNLTVKEWVRREERMVKK